jgi:hypothetical protein
MVFTVRDWSAPEPTHGLNAPILTARANTIDDVQSPMKQETTV